MFTADHGPAGKSLGVEQTADWTENCSCPTGDMDSELVYRALKGHVKGLRLDGLDRLEKVTHGIQPDSVD